MENDTAPVEFTSRKTENLFASPDIQALGARLAVENQSGRVSRQTEASLVNLELYVCRTKYDASDPPEVELPFSVKPVKGVVVHGGEIGEAAQRLAVGGQIRKRGDRLEIAFPSEGSLSIGLKTGDVSIDSANKYQKEVHFEDSPWQRTILTSNDDTRITVGSLNISSIERNGVMEIFPRSYSKLVGAEPRIPASEELFRKFSDRGRQDLNAELSRIDRQEDSAEEAVIRNGSDKSTVSALSSAEKSRGLFLEKAARLLPDDAVKLDACAENELRTALHNMRAFFGAGTPESQNYAQALLDLLNEKDNAGQQEERDRLTFEAKRGRLMKSVVEDIEDAFGESHETVSRERATDIKNSLISIYIAGGDSGLKSFVDEINGRLESSVLIAPLGLDGPFRPGAIILTPEGPSRYNGSFDLVRKQ
jgi:hypothetical protein